MKLLLGLDEAEQGWLLLSGPVGNLVSFTFVGALVARIGSRRSLIGACTLYIVAALGVATCFLARAPLPFWCVALAAMAMVGNIFNISVNAQGGLVERQAGRTIMNSFHAMFSAMGLVAALVALAASNVGVPPGWRLVGVLAVGLLAHLVFLPGLPKTDDTTAKKKGAGLCRPDAQLLLLGLAALVIMGCEGAIVDWVGVFYHDALGAPPGRVKWGFCAVCAMMTLGRFVTDPIVNRFGAAIVLRLHCALTAAGLALALCSPWLGVSGLALHAVATAGYAAAGYGISALVPILYSKANKTQAMPAASALTFIGSMGFLGYFVWPPMIGHVAHRTNLSVALGIFAVLMVSCAFLRLGEDRRAARQSM